MVVPVRVVTQTEEHRVSVSVQSMPGPELKAYVLSGRVTELSITQGQQLMTGDVVFLVNDAPRLAMVSEGPLWRDLGRGDEGPDVERLQTFLGQLGLFDGSPDGLLGGETVEAIRNYNRMFAMSASPDTFESDNVVWVGDAPFDVAEVVVTLGDVLVEGTVIATGPAVVESVIVDEPVGLDQEVGEFVLDIAGTSVPYVPGSRHLTDPDFLQAVADAVVNMTDPVGVVRRKVPVTVAVIPASSVVTGPQSGVCVFVPRGDWFAPIVIEPIGGGVATVELASPFEASEVLANPHEVLASQTCN